MSSTTSAERTSPFIQARDAAIAMAQAADNVLVLARGRNDEFTARMGRIAGERLWRAIQDGQSLIGAVEHQLAAVNPNPVTIPQWDIAEASAAAAAFQLGATIIRAVWKGAGEDGWFLAMKFDSGDPKFAKVEEYWPDVCDELLMKDPCDVRELLAMVMQESARAIQNVSQIPASQGGQADRKADTIQKFVTIPKNNDVVRLDKKIKAEGCDKIDAAREITEGDETKAQSLTRQHRRHRTALDALNPPIP